MDRWEYLVSKEYMLRHHICEYFFGDDLDAVIDVGAYKNTIKTHNRLIAIDPLKSIPGAFHGSVQDWFEGGVGDLKLTNCGIMAMGLEIEGGESEWACFKAMVDSARVVIIEHSIEHVMSVLQANDILESTDKKVTVTINFEFCDLDLPGFVPHTKRRLIVLERK
jgi:hypothetical protein